MRVSRGYLRSGFCAIPLVFALVGTSVASPEEEPEREPDPPPAYRLRRDVDVPLLAFGAVLAGAWYMHGQLAPAFCAPRCDRATVNPLDRTVAGNWSPGWARAGDLATAGMFVAPALALLLVERPGAALNDLVVIGETVLLTSAVATIAQMGFRRPRPFLYGDEAPTSARDRGNGSLSFFSGHTATTFAATFATFEALGRLRPGSRARYWVLGGGLATASFIGATRTLSGNHFPTDVLAGAVIGSAIGLVVPSLHGRGLQVTPSATANDVSLQLAARF